jgi:hypothetical protein
MLAAPLVTACDVARNDQQMPYSRYYSQLTSVISLLVIRGRPRVRVSPA